MTRCRLDVLRLGPHFLLLDMLCSKTASRLALMLVEVELVQKRYEFPSRVPPRSAVLFVRGADCILYIRPTLTCACIVVHRAILCSLVWSQKDKSGCC
jgi:hypothetical protein